MWLKGASLSHVMQADRLDPQKMKEMTAENARGQESAELFVPFHKRSRARDEKLGSMPPSTRPCEAGEFSRGQAGRADLTPALPRPAISCSRANTSIPAPGCAMAHGCPWPPSHGRPWPWAHFHALPAHWRERLGWTGLGSTAGRGGPVQDRLRTIHNNSTYCEYYQSEKF